MISQAHIHEARLVGRGGQGVVTAGDLLGMAAIHEGQWAQSIPTFGPERRGALCTSTLRTSNRELLLKCAAAEPDALVCLDPTIWRHAPVLGGMKPGAKLIFNSKMTPEELVAELFEETPTFQVFTVDATSIALEALGRAITNTAMIGAFVGATGVVGMEAVERALLDRFGKRGERNVAAARAARDSLTELGG